ALGRAAGVEDLKPVGAALVQRDVGVAEDHGTCAREAAAKALDPPLTRPRIVDYGQRKPAAEIQFDRGRQRAVEGGVVHVAVNREDRAERSQLLENAQL